MQTKERESKLAIDIPHLVGGRERGMIGPRTSHPFCGGGEGNPGESCNTGNFVTSVSSLTSALAICFFTIQGFGGRAIQLSLSCRVGARFSHLTSKQSPKSPASR